MMQSAMARLSRPSPEPIPICHHWRIINLCREARQMGLFTGILLLKPLRLRCTFAASCDVQLSRPDVSFIEVTRGCQWGESVGCQPTLRRIPGGEAMMRVGV